MFYQNSLGGKGKKKEEHNKEEWKDMRSGLIIHSTMTLTTLTCGQLWSFQKPVALILCLVLAIYPVWFICLSQGAGQVHMKHQTLKIRAYRGSPGRGHVHVYNLPWGVKSVLCHRHPSFAVWFFFNNRKGQQWVGWKIREHAFRNMKHLIE